MTCLTISKDGYIGDTRSEDETLHLWNAKSSESGRLSYVGDHFRKHVDDCVKVK